MFEVGLVNISFMRALFVVGLLASTACTEKNPLFCAADSECTTGRICDITGDFAGTSNVCIPTPDDCPVERCGCSPGEGFTCDGDQLTSCSADGTSTVTSTCALGCSTEARCLSFEPSNGLNSAFVMAEHEPEIALPNGTRIDTTTGIVEDADGVAIPVTSSVIDQDGGSSIRVFVARSWVVDDVRVTGSRSMAFVAFESITIRGVLDASADTDLSGPGGQEDPSVCVGVATATAPGCTFSCTASGAGGGGNATSGGRGGSLTFPGGGLGGALIPTFNPLVGGCRGGAFVVAAGPIAGGAGGGGLQLVAGSSVELTARGLIDLGGGGGQTSAGGGSGGTAVIEAPTVHFEGSATGFVANGGAGGGCGANGADGTRTTFRAAAPKCTDKSAGDGGTTSVPPQAGQIKCTSGTCSSLGDQYGGGGGAVGRLMVATRDGEFTVNGSPALSVVITKTMLTPK